MNPMKNYVDHLPRRDLIAKSTISPFDDSPERFQSWKRSFENTVEGIPLTPHEELSLMVSNMRPNSEGRPLLEGIRNMHFADPATSLQTAWKRLKERFGSEEAVTRALYAKLEKLSYLNNGGEKALQSFGDILEHVNSAKERSDLPGLAALDTPYLLNPVAAKLPRDLADKWRNGAFKYKERTGTV